MEYAFILAERWREWRHLIKSVRDRSRPASEQNRKRRYILFVYAHFGWFMSETVTKIRHSQCSSVSSPYEVYPLLGHKQVDS